MPVDKKDWLGVEGIPKNPRDKFASFTQTLLAEGMFPLCKISPFFLLSTFKIC